MRPTTLAGLLLVIVPLGFNTTFLMLQRAFEYPDILRKPTEYILRRFKEGGASLRRLWYAFTFSAILFAPVPVLVQQIFEPNVPWYLPIGTAVGVLAEADRLWPVHGRGSQVRRLRLVRAVPRLL